MCACNITDAFLNDVIKTCKTTLEKIMTASPTSTDIYFSYQFSVGGDDDLPIENRNTQT